MNSPKLLALVSADTSSSDADAMSVEISSAFAEKFHSPKPEVVHSRTWYEKHFELCQGWEDWIWTTVMEKPYGSRRHHFDGFVLCTDRLGRANKGIASLALDNQRVVLSWEPRSQRLGQVTDVVEVDGNDWKTGWTYRSVSISE